MNLPYNQFIKEFYFDDSSINFDRSVREFQKTYKLQTEDSRKAVVYL